ncbi:bifunctional phosphopantothenoylcysteine decarboxylase/phosphopantothenate--cysteine ligase CoaBC [Spirochaeta dissipatitropha]
MIVEPENHPSRDIIGTLGSQLAGRKIVLAICGSVAAVRCVDIARLLMRHGAEVIPVMSQAACELISPDLMEWATGYKPVTRLTGAIEHVALAGNVPDPCDLVLVAPATANTISKIAVGIDDTPVTTVVTTALGQGIPVYIVPAMHEPMYRHAIVGRNIQSLNDAGIPVFVPPVSEGKAKIPGPETIVAMVRSLLHFKGTRPLKGKRVLITAGRTVEYLDPVRIISNNSTGRMGNALALVASALGAEVILVQGKVSVSPPETVSVRSISTAAEMMSAVHEELAAAPVDLLIAAAAVGDWQAAEKSERKISTSQPGGYSVDLVPTPKIIDGIKNRSPATRLIAFRAQAGLSDQELYDDAFARLKKASAEMIVANDTAREGVGFEHNTNAVRIVHADGSLVDLALDDKLGIAIGIFSEYFKKHV